MCLGPCTNGMLRMRRLALGQHHPVHTMLDTPPVQALQGLLRHLLWSEQQLVDGLLPPAAPRHAQQHLTKYSSPEKNCDQAAAPLRLLPTCNTEMGAHESCVNIAAPDAAGGTLQVGCLQRASAIRTSSIMPARLFMDTRLMASCAKPVRSTSVVYANMLKVLPRPTLPDCWVHHAQLVGCLTNAVRRETPQALWSSPCP